MAELDWASYFMGPDIALSFNNSLVLKAYIRKLIGNSKCFFPSCLLNRFSTPLDQPVWNKNPIFLSLLNYQNLLRCNVFKHFRFQTCRNVCDRLSELQHTLNLANAMQELEMLLMIKDSKGSLEDVKHGSNEPCLSDFLKCLEDGMVSVESQESLAVEAANSLMSKLRSQLEPFRYVVDEASPWEEKSAAVKLANKVNKSKRNKLWRKKKRKRVAEMLAKEREQFDQMDREADEWIARENAKEIANSKVLKMKEIAKSKAKEEKKKLAAEAIFSQRRTTSFLRGFKLQWKKRSVKLWLLLKQMLLRMQLQLLTAEESRKAIQNQGKLQKGSNDDSEVKESKEQIVHSVADEGSDAVDKKKSSKIGQACGGAYDPLANLPIEFYHYYHGSNFDMGTLIEVRRGWDAYIRPGGSRIPGHWVQPPPPANEIWASYLVRPK